MIKTELIQHRAKQMAAEFRANHVQAADSGAPYESAEGGYQYPLADARDWLNDNFQNDEHQAIEVACGLLLDNDWVSNKFLEEIYRD